MERGQLTATSPRAGEAEPPILIRLLGSFGLFKRGQPLPVRSGGRAEALLYQLALRHEYGVPRETLLEALWPENDAALAGQSLNSLVYSIHRLLGDAIGDAAPVVHESGCYRLNVAAGVGVDVASFTSRLQEGDRRERLGDSPGAADAYRSAIELYRGDLIGTDLQALVERERLRAAYLNLLARLSDYYFELGDYAASLESASQLLLHDACREDAHRVVMRCYVRQVQRSQALRQYRLCEAVLRREFDAAPEPLTVELFEQVRLDPGGV